MSRETFVAFAAQNSVVNNLSSMEVPLDCGKSVLVIGVLAIGVQLRTIRVVGSGEDPAMSAIQSLSLGAIPSLAGNAFQVRWMKHQFKWRTNREDIRCRFTPSHAHMHGQPVWIRGRSSIGIESLYVARFEKSVQRKKG